MYSRLPLGTSLYSYVKVSLSMAYKHSYLNCHRILQLGRSMLHIHYNMIGDTETEWLGYCRGSLMTDFRCLGSWIMSPHKDLQYGVHVHMK